MSRLLCTLLSRFLTLPVVEGGEADPPADPAAGEDLPAGDLDDPLAELAGLDEPADPAGDPPPEEVPAVKRAREETRRANEALETERNYRKTIEARLPAPAPSRDPQYEAEERQLAEARRTGNAESIGWLEWKVNTDRTNRQVRAEAQSALAESRDLADQTAFNQLAVTKPAVHKRYAARVEAEMEKLRGRGERLPPRSAILQFLVGGDALNNSGKPKPKPTPSTVDRGRMPQTRTDVSGRAGGASEREKRRERLRNAPI